MENQAFHTTSDKVTAGMSADYLMEDCLSYLLTWRFFLKSKNAWECSHLAFWKLVELQAVISIHNVSQSVFVA